jgi:DNA-directed RNA polymerase specialized sigma24 family protein
LPGELAFKEWMGRVRAGDQQAAAALVGRYAPLVEKSVRVRLFRLRLHRLLEAADVSQVVLARFFRHAAAGRLRLERPEQVRKVLLRMARNDVIDAARHHRAARRDHTRIERGFPQDGLELFEDTAPTPGAVVAARDLLGALFRRLSDEDRDLAEQRALGRDWAALAAERGTTPGALRKRLARALDRAGRTLGLYEMDLGQPATHL